eukprot:7609266-Alexandrium_andersonii.AAC.1
MWHDAAESTREREGSKDIGVGPSPTPAQLYPPPPAAGSWSSRRRRAWSASTLRACATRVAPSPLGPLPSWRSSAT